MTTFLDVQKKVKELGFDPGKLDGLPGPKSFNAILQALGGAKPLPAEKSLFDAGSAKRLAAAHPLLQEVMNEARKSIKFRILDSQRGEEAQELAVKQGHSKAHFGQSAHNWSPAIAVDIVPEPLDWDDKQSFIALSKVILPLAKKMGIPLRWGGDWNMDGSTSDGWDFPHYELHPWRDWAKETKPYVVNP